MKKLLFVIIALLCVPIVSAHVELYHSYTELPLLILLTILIVALYLYERIGDTALGHSILFVGLAIALYIPLFSPFSVPSAQTLMWLAVIIAVGIVAIIFYHIRRLKKKVMLLALLGLLLLSVVGAHDLPTRFSEDEYTDPDVLVGQPLWVKGVFYIWLSHDRIHWVFVVLMLWTCYHFRYFFGRKVAGHPRFCGQLKDERDYTGDRKFHSWHRYFWWANVVLIGIHWSEVITGWTFGLDYTYTFSYQLLGIVVESLYVVTFTLWLLSCHFFKYLFINPHCRSCGLNAMAPAEMVANKYHGVFMWATVASGVLLLLLVGHL